MVRPLANGEHLPEGAIACLGTTVLRHGWPLTKVAVSPDSSSIASVGYNDTLRMWDARTGQLKQTLIAAKKDGYCYDVGFTPDGKFLACACGDHVCVWDVRTAGPARTLALEDSFATVLRFLPDSSTVIVGYTHGGVSVWDLASGSWKKDLYPRARPLGAPAVAPFLPSVEALAHCAQNGLVAVGRCGGDVDFIDLDNRKPIHRLRNFWWVDALTFSEDGANVAGASGEKIRLWRVATLKEVRSFSGHQHNVTSVAFLPGTGILLSGSHDGTVRLWKVANGTCLRTVHAHNAGVRTLAVSADGRFFVTGSEDRTLRVWQLPRCEELIPTPGHRGPVSCLAFTADGARLVSGSKNGGMSLWDVASRKEIGSFAGHSSGSADWRSGVRSVTTSPDGKVVASSGSDHTVRIWDAGTRAEVRKLTNLQDRESVESVAFAPGGQVLAIAGWSGEIRICDVSTGNTVRALESSDDLVAFTPDGRFLLSGGRNAYVKLWDRQSGECCLDFTHPNLLFPVRSLAISPDGKTAAAGLNKQMVLLWEFTNGKNARFLQGHDQRPVSSVCFSGDGCLLVSSGYDCTICLWETASGGLVRKFKLNDTSANCVALSADGKTLASGNDDTTILLWKLTPDDIANISALSERQLISYWMDILSPDAGKAWRGIWALSGCPHSSMPFLTSHITPERRVAPAYLARLMKDLDSPSFRIREQATHDLEQLGEIAETALDETLSRHPTPEARRRAEAILQKIPGSLRQVTAARKVALLERIGSLDAVRVLESLSRGEPAALQTLAADTALKRLARSRTR